MWVSTQIQMYFTKSNKSAPKIRSSYIAVSPHSSHLSCWYLTYEWNENINFCRQVWFLKESFAGFNSTPIVLHHGWQIASQNSLFIYHNITWQQSPFSPIFDIKMAWKRIFLQTSLIFEWNFCGFQLKTKWTIQWVTHRP